MKAHPLLPGLFLLLLATLTPAAVTHAAVLPRIVDQSTAILAGRQGSGSPIPQKEIDDAKGVAIINITKGGFVFGGLGGDGVVLVKRPSNLPGVLGQRNWGAPIPIGFAGGTFGAQVGGSTTRAIILLHSDHAVQRFTNPGKVGWNANASGTVGNDTQSEGKGILSDVDVKIYQSTEGLYGGAVFGGSSLSINHAAISESYGSGSTLRDILDGKIERPDYCKRLVELLNGKR